MGQEKNNTVRNLFCLVLIVLSILLFAFSGVFPQGAMIGLITLFIGAIVLGISVSRPKQKCPHCLQPVRRTSVNRKIISGDEIHSCPHCGAVLSVAKSSNNNEGCLLCLLLSAVYIAVQFGPPVIEIFLS